MFLAGTAAAEPSQNARVGQLAVIAFERGKSELPVEKREKNQLELGKVAAWTLENPEGILVIDGHADREGSHAANVRMSLARAQSVRDQLVLAGANPDQIVVSARGDRANKRHVVIWGTKRPTAVATRPVRTQVKIR